MGELLQSIWKEAIGNDPENQRTATLPLKAGKLSIGLGALGLNDGP